MLDLHIKGAAKGGVASRNVLLLGISYPCVPSQMAKHGYPEDILTYPEPSVEQAVECVRRGILTEMDARDLARCVATEQATGTNVYSVSREIGAIYRSDRHIHCDFNARNFCQTLQNAFGPDIQFSQVILDYYWMPTGWLVTRWAKTLFQQTLPDLVKHRMLTFPSRRKSKQRRSSAGPAYDIDEGAVYLPFCAHVCKELVGAVHILEQYYEITFLNKQNLHGHALWKGTMEIDGHVMQTRLGKRLDQEEIYCTFRPKDIYESMEDPHVSKPAVMRILLAIKNYDDIRMVKLRPLRQHEKASVFRDRLWQDEIGGFKGLDFQLSARLQKELKKRGRKKYLPFPIVEEEKKEDGATAATGTAKKKGKTNKKTKTKKAGNKKEPRTTRKMVAKQVAPVEDEVRAEKEIVSKCQDVETPDPNELKRYFCYYPGPTRDLDTYIDHTQIVIEDEQRVAEEEKEQIWMAKCATKKTARHRHTLNAGKGVVHLPDDKMEDPLSRRRKVKVQDPVYLSHNPRVPPVRKLPGEDFVGDTELDHTVFPDETLDLTFDEEIENGSSKPPNAKMLQAASVLYHCIFQGLEAPNEEKGGVKRVARMPKKACPDTACFSVDIVQADYQEFTGYDFESAEMLMDHWQQHEKTMSDVVEICRGGQDWVNFFVDDDGKWFGTRKLRESTAIFTIQLQDDPQEYMIDRVQNRKYILMWLLGDRNADDDLSGCFRVAESCLSPDVRQAAGDNVAKLTVVIEKQFYHELKAASWPTLPRYQQFQQSAEMYEAIKDYLIQYLMDKDRAANTMVEMHKSSASELEELYHAVREWIDSKCDSSDPTGEFRRVEESHGGSFEDLSKEEQCHKIAKCTVGTRYIAKYIEEKQRDQVVEQQHRNQAAETLTHLQDDEKRGAASSMVELKTSYPRSRSKNANGTTKNYAAADSQPRPLRRNPEEDDEARRYQPHRASTRARLPRSATQPAQLNNTDRDRLQNMGTRGHTNEVERSRSPSNTDSCCASPQSEDYGGAAGRRVRGPLPSSSDHEDTPAVISTASDWSASSPSASPSPVRIYDFEMTENSDQVDRLDDGKAKRTLSVDVNSSERSRKSRRHNDAGPEAGAIKKVSSCKKRGQLLNNDKALLQSKAADHSVHANAIAGKVSSEAITSTQTDLTSDRTLTVRERSDSSSSSKVSSLRKLETSPQCDNVAGGLPKGCNHSNTNFIEKAMETYSQEKMKRSIPRTARTPKDGTTTLKKRISHWHGGSDQVDSLVSKLSIPTACKSKSAKETGRRRKETGDSVGRRRTCREFTSNILEDTVLSRLPRNDASGAVSLGESPATFSAVQGVESAGPSTVFDMHEGSVRGKSQCNKAKSSRQKRQSTQADLPTAKLFCLQSTQELEFAEENIVGFSDNAFPVQRRERVATDYPHQMQVETLGRVGSTTDIITDEELFGSSDPDDQYRLCTAF